MPRPISLRVARIRRGLSQVALAEKAGVNTRTVIMIERGRTRHSWPRTRLALAQALEMPMEDIKELRPDGRSA